MNKEETASCSATESSDTSLILRLHYESEEITISDSFER